MPADIPRQVALVTAPRNETWPDDEVPLIIDAFRRHGVHAESTPWYNPRDWSSYDLIVLRSGSWDIFIDDGGARARQYFQWLDETALQGASIVSSRFIAQWVTDKRYLNHLERKGVPIVPTTYIEVGEEPELPGTKFVVKPVFGAGALGVGAYEAADKAQARQHVAALHSRGLAVMIQPYIETLHDTELGERALIFFNGVFGYAIGKDPVVDVGEDPFAFRADDHPNPRLCDPQNGDMDVALATLHNLPIGEQPFVARIDVVTYAGRSVLTEASIDDPVLFLDLAPDGAADQYVKAAIAQWRDHPVDA